MINICRRLCLSRKKYGCVCIVRDGGFDKNVVLCLDIQKFPAKFAQITEISFPIVRQQDEVYRQSINLDHSRICCLGGSASASVKILKIW